MALRASFIRQGSTPALEVEVENQHLDTATIYVTIETGDRKLTLTNYKDQDDVTTQISGRNTIITASLSQADTAYLHPGFGKAQVRWVFEDGNAGVSDCGRIEIGESLLKGVIAYG